MESRPRQQRLRSSPFQENAMRTPFGMTAAIALMLGSAADAQAQTTYGGVARPYHYSDEPLMSINRSYLGYSNFVDYGPGLPAHANPPPRGGYAAAPAPVYAAPRAPVYTAPRAPVYTAPPAPAYATAPAQPYSAPVRRGRLFGWFRGYR
jgi:hypothetical protein